MKYVNPIKIKNMNTEILCCADFKALQQFPAKCHVWANNSQRAALIDFAVSKGYIRAGEKDVSHDASILTFARTDRKLENDMLHAGQSISVAELLGKFQRGAEPLTVNQFTAVLGFAHLLRVLTIEETIKTQIDGTQRPNENKVIIPSNITI